MKPIQPLLFSLISVSFFLGTAPARAEEQPLKVFLLGGQSNMLGDGLFAEVPPAMLAAQPEVLICGNILEAGRITTKFQPLDYAQFPGDHRRIGPEATFGQKMLPLLREKKVGLIKFALGGTSLGNQWLPGKPEGLYAQFIKLVKEARGAGKIQILGMIWMQGESDAVNDQRLASQYGDNFKALVNGVRRDLDLPELPFVYGRINSFLPQFPKTDLIRTAQEQYAKTDPRAAMIDCDDLAKNGDKLHYSAKGQIELGTRFAGAMGKLLTPGR